MEGLIEVIKTEAEIDPLALHDEEEKRPLSVEGNFLKVVFKEIKVEPSDQSYDLLSDIKYEENKVPSLHSVVKFEVEEESCAVKQEQLSDVSVQDDDLAERSVQVECREVDSLLGAAHKCGVCNQHCDDLEDHECTRPFKCDVCDKRFRNKKNVKVHMGCHTDDDGLRKNWYLSNSRQGDKPGTLFTPSEASRVCSSHLKEAEIRIKTRRKRKLLLPTMVPSVFVDFPKHKQLSVSIDRGHKRMVTEIRNNIHTAKKNIPDVDSSTSLNERRISVAEVYETQRKTKATQCSIGNKLILNNIKLQHKRITRKIKKQNQLIKELRLTIRDLKGEVFNFQKQNQKEKHGIENRVTCQTKRSKGRR
ncbi:uncharacterized protein [Periplaneta americana]|uniref:uncharacterized protein isoform X1 n=1 Tax=Periplaneta americana TaxID=6978 RepID=UPI0037E77F81